MARSLTDRIEQYIKTLIERSSDKQIEIQRMEIAETFSCVPSQVTYVVSTRFKPECGYLAESRRGGNGYMRIRKLEVYFPQQVMAAADRWILNLCAQKHLSEREALLTRCFYHQALEPAPMPEEDKMELLRQSMELFFKIQEHE